MPTTFAPRRRSIRYSWHRHARPSPAQNRGDSKAAGKTKRAMAKAEAKIRRTLHFKFTLSGASEQMIAMMKSAAPLYSTACDTPPVPSYCLWKRNIRPGCTPVDTHDTLPNR